ncbi:MAG: ATP-binding protein [Betaproteobacteria bacterium]
MTSIRRRLLVWLLVGLSLATAVGAWAVYLRARAEARDLFDYQLRLMAGTFPYGGFSSAVAPPASTLGNDVVVVQIWDSDGARLYLSRPDSRPPRSSEIGFSTVHTASGDWRVYTALVGDNVVQVSQSTSLREELAAGIALRTMLPLVLLLPVLVMLILVTIGRGLKPLEDVAAAVRRRTADALDPLPEAPLPEEVRSLVGALNGLLARLGSALDLHRNFIADAAHELRTPLTALRLQIQLAERATDAAGRAAALAQLRGGAERATRLVEQLLALARSEPAAATLPMAPVELTELARQMVAELAPVAAEQGLDLGMSSSASAPVRVHGDAEALRVLLGNLIDNAIRYTPRGGSIDVEASMGGGTPTLAVVDDGPGIPPAERGRVFDRFYRLPAGGVTGSGLGLAIVRRIADRHGAVVELADGLRGRGLKVTVRFES